jgi:hypothetical protein
MLKGLGFRFQVLSFRVWWEGRLLAQASFLSKPSNRFRAFS